ncbi:MAG: hypothetical protein BWY79_01154 [Actinobacteria bacterium ADurb.Bin444]|nr:MAG: hypothetical protein BWY79_01154 [Actinobacteria bacterium ADurb.Bin444]
MSTSGVCRPTPSTTILANCALVTGSSGRKYHRFDPAGFSLPEAMPRWARSKMKEAKM